MTLHYSLIFGFINEANITEFKEYILNNENIIENYGNIINYTEYTDLIIDDLINSYDLQTPQMYSYEQLYELLTNSVNDKKYNLSAIYSILLNNYTKDNMICVFGCGRWW